MGAPRTVVIQADGTLRCDGGVGPGVPGRYAGRYGVHEGALGVLLFEPTGGMGSEESRERLVTYGEVTGATTVLESLQSVTATGWRGNVTVVTEGARRQLRVNRGILTSAKSNVASERLGELMIRRGMITEEQLRHCLRQSGAGRRIGEAVVLEGLIDPEELFAALQAQARCIFDNALLTASGYYLCTVPPEDALPPAMAVHLPVQALLMESMQRIDEVALFRERVPNGHVCLRSVAVGEPTTLDPELRAVAELSTGKASILDIARELRLDEFTVTKRVVRLLDLGCLEIVDVDGNPEERIERLMSQLNEILQHIGRTADEHGSSDNMAWTFREWVRDTPLGSYFAIAPQADGSMAVDLARQALDQLAVRDGCAALRQAAVELVSFALFAANPALSAGEERRLREWVNDRVVQLTL